MTQNINYEVRKREEIMNTLWMDPEELQRLKRQIEHASSMAYSSLKAINEKLK